MLAAPAVLLLVNDERDKRPLMCSISCSASIRAIHRRF